MTEKAVAAGWVVQLTTPGVSTGGTPWRGPVLADASVFQFFNIAVAAADKAIEAARKHAGAGADAPMSAVRQLSKAEIEFLGLRAGEAKPA